MARKKKKRKKSAINTAVKRSTTHWSIDDTGQVY